ncbi:MAG: tetratricopeptide repeat protein [Elusimicrobia bacterium]|nr:tetratricopeptide repeat protein [Elusimicrobiota bacterium]
MIPDTVKILLVFVIISASGAYAATEDAERLIFRWMMPEAARAIESMKEPDGYIQGLYSFFMGDYEKADGYFAGSPGKSAGWAALTSSILETSRKFETAETEYFSIRFTGKDRILAMYLAGIVDAAAEKVRDRFGYEPGEKILIEIYPSRESFKTASTLTDQQIKVSGAIGICKFNRIMVASPRILKFGYSWVDTVVHEYIHYAIAKITGLENMPLWLNEGLAKYNEVVWRKEKGELDPVDINYLVKGRDSGGWIEFEKMKHGMPTLESKDEVALAFAQVQSVTDYIIEQYGWDKMRTYLRKLMATEPGRAFEEVYGRKIEDINGEWKKYISSRTMDILPGAGGPSYAFDEDPVNALTEWVSEEAYTDIRVADRFSESGRYDLAVKKYEDALKKDPGNAVVLNRLARVRIALGDSENAMKELLEAVGSNSSYCPPYLYIGEILYNQKKYAEAERYFLEYVYRSPFNPAPHVFLKKIYSGFNRNSEVRRESGILELLDEN